MKRFIFPVIISLFSLLGLSSCANSQKGSGDSFHEITAEKDKKDIFNYCVDYELNVPGSEISYYAMWTGSNSSTSSTSENRYYSYLVEYNDDQNQYYWITIKRNKLTGFDDWYKTYKEDHSRDVMNYHFSDDSNVYDGKVLLFAQKQKVDDYKVYCTSNPFDTAFIKKDEQLAICLQTKTITAIENISSQETLNKSIRVLNRFEVAFNARTSTYEKYTFEGPEASNILLANSIFSYAGKRIECYPGTFEDLDYCYCPLMGLYGSGRAKTKRVNLLNDNEVLLPRYQISADGSRTIDLLDNSVNIFPEDVYRDLKSLFLDAFISETSTVYGSYEYSLFNYEKVAKIIRGGK